MGKHFNVYFVILWPPICREKSVLWAIEEIFESPFYPAELFEKLANLIFAAEWRSLL